MHAIHEFRSNELHSPLRLKEVCFVGKYLEFDQLVVEWTMPISNLTVWFCLSQTWKREKGKSLPDGVLICDLFVFTAVLLENKLTVYMSYLFR